MNDITSPRTRYLILNSFSYAAITALRRKSKARDTAILRGLIDWCMVFALESLGVHHRRLGCACGYDIL